ncbi:MAG: disulfide bond formation protein B [Candidatus Pacebacteria bacterium]|jgi:disulfide bond formation protein DsbB|nr:disulfide bond formation protein B [Candidatus Paceibacterota bacterium]
MPEWILISNKIMASGVLILQFISLYIIFSLLIKKDPIGISTLVGKYFKEVGITISLMSMALSLFYSEVIGFPPCKLCVVQRFLMYPQLLFFIIAKYNPKNIFIKIPVSLSVIGFFVSIFHYLVELGIFSSSLICGATGPSCAERYVFEFGYISIPMMAFAGFTFILLAFFANKMFSPTK